MFIKNQKAQLSIELVIIIGIIIIGTIIFAIFYLSTTSKNIGRATEALEKEVDSGSSLINKENVSIPAHTLAVCGDGILSPGEACDTNGPIFPSGTSCSGNLTCNNCIEIICT